MTISERDFAKKITSYLDRSNAQLKAGTAYKLQLARGRALAGLATADTATNLTLAGAHGSGGNGSTAQGHYRGAPRWWGSRALWVGIVLIVVSGLVFQQWQATQQVKDITETDAAILSSELPIDAFLDRGFQNWLKLGED